MRLLAITRLAGSMPAPHRHRHRHHLVLAAAALLGTSALGYILPSAAILRRLAEGRDELTFATLKVEGTLTLYGSAALEGNAALGLPSNDPELQTEATVLMKLPGRCRFDVTSVDTGKASSSIDARGKRRVEGSPIGALGVVLAEVCPLLAARSGSDAETRATLDRHLTALKVDVRKTSLARFGGQVAYLLGDPSDGHSQLWVYKDSFLPARVRYSDPAGTAYDVRFLDYSGPATGESFPRTVEVVRGTELVLKFTALKGDQKAKLDDRLF